MADKKISELPAASAIDTNDLLAVVEDGTTVKATVQDLLDLVPSSSEIWSVPTFTPSVGTDQTTTMTAAIDALPDEGGIVMIPRGTFYTRMLIDSHSGVTFRGTGMGATTIVAPTGSPIVEVSNTPRGDYTFEDMTFDMDSSGATTMPVYPDDNTVTFRRCRFVGVIGYAVGLLGAVGTIIEDCEFDGQGNAEGSAVYCANGVRGLRWIRSKSRFMSQGIVFDSTPHDEIDIDGGLFDGGWYLLRTRPGGYTNSGGTVTYTSTTVVDSAASFGAIPTPADVNVRALPVLESGSTGTTYVSGYLNDSTATFVTALVKPGYIVRTATKWAVVARVASETRLYVEEWFDSTTYSVTDPPASAAAYTVHRVLLGVVQSNTGTAVTVERWYDFHDGATVLPAAGTLYEVLINHGEYSGIHASADSVHATGAIRNIRVHGGCHFTRTWNDQLSIYGGDARLTVDSTVLIDHGEDFGITCHGHRARISGTVVHNGACGIYTSGDDCQISAYASGSPWVNTTNTVYLGDILISGHRTRVSGSVVVASGPQARHGIVVAGPHVDTTPVNAVDLSGTTAHGYTVGEYRLYSLTSPTVGVTNTNLRGVTGVVSSDGASGTIGPRYGTTINTVTAAGSTETLDGATYDFHDITLDVNVTFTFTTTATVAQFTLILRQDGSGTNTVTWPGSVKWHAATAPTILTTGNAVHVLEFLTVDSGSTWRGFLASSNVS